MVPLGSTEQHAHLSLATDLILADRVASEAAEPLGVPVFPALPYGITPYFTDYPGTISLSVETYVRLLDDVLANLKRMGVRRVLLVNGHGGNAPGGAFAKEWVSRNPVMRVKIHNWWNAPRTWAKVEELGPVGSHASWTENFPWTRLEDASVPLFDAPFADRERMDSMTPAEVRTHLGVGCMGGLSQRSDEDMQALWEVGVAETRAALEGPWG